MSRTRRNLRVLLLATASALVLLLPVVAWQDYVSLERGNRLYRNGSFAGAVRLYRRHVPAQAPRPPVSYNLGTAWLALGSDAEAEANLTQAQEAEDPEVRYRAYYNHGHLLYAQGLQLTDRAMAAPLVGEAVLAYRDALRVRPESEDARWNLALAMQALDSVTRRQMAVLQGIPTRENPVGLGEAGGRLAIAGLGEAGELSPEESGEGLMPSDQRRQLGGGAREALAEANDPGVNTFQEITQVLAAVDDNVSNLLRRILWFGGPRGSGARAPRGGEW